MMNNKKKIFLRRKGRLCFMNRFFSRLLPALCILAPLAVSAAAQQEEPAVVRVGTRVYCQSEVQLY